MELAFPTHPSVLFYNVFRLNFKNSLQAIELSLNKGELVVLTRRVDDNWFEGRIANRKGIFPVSYVDVSSPFVSIATGGVLTHFPHYRF